LHFFFYFGEGFFILYKQREENRKVRLIDIADDFSILLIRIIWIILNLSVM